MEIDNTPGGQGEPPTIDVVPTLSEVPDTEVLHPEQLPQGYSAVQSDDNTYIIYDDEGVPLGYVVVPDGMSLEDINILDELIPFGAPELVSIEDTSDTGTGKNNPKTSNANTPNHYWPVAVILMAAIGGLVVIRRRELSKIQK